MVFLDAIVNSFYIIIQVVSLAGIRFSNQLR